MKPRYRYWTKQKGENTSWLPLGIFFALEKTVLFDYQHGRSREGLQNSEKLLTAISKPMVMSFMILSAKEKT
ncbi:hypothetical protein MASR2M47_21120 [Draconibacterium sp.]